MKSITCATWLLCGVSAYDSHAAEFVNLDFDYASLASLKYYPEYGGGYGLAADMFPGWSITVNGVPYTGLIASLGVEPYGSTSFGAGLGLTGPSPFVIGKHGVYFTSSRESVPGQPGLAIPVIMSQRGTVPSDTYYLSGFGGTIVRANGNVLARHTYGPFDHPAWDIHEYAGKEIELSLFFQGKAGGFSTDFDILGFAAPEPKMSALLVVGTCVLVFGFVWRPKTGK